MAGQGLQVPLVEQLLFTLAAEVAEVMVALWAVRQERVALGVEEPGRFLPLVLLEQLTQVVAVEVVGTTQPLSTMAVQADQALLSFATQAHLLMRQV